MLQRWWCEQMCRWGSYPGTALCPSPQRFLHHFWTQTGVELQKKWLLKGFVWVTSVVTLKFEKKEKRFPHTWAGCLRVCLLELSERFWCCVVSYLCFCTRRPESWSSHLEPRSWTEYSLLSFWGPRNFLINRSAVFHFYTLFEFSFEKPQ